MQINSSACQHYESSEYATARQHTCGSLLPNREDTDGVRPTRHLSKGGVEGTTTISIPRVHEKRCGWRVRVVTGSTCFEMHHHVTAITHTSACSMLRRPTTSTKRNKSLRPPPVVQLTVSLRDQIEITLDNRAPKNRGGGFQKKERKKAETTPCSNLIRTNNLGTFPSRN